MEEELEWQTYRPRDLGNRRMGASPVTHVVMYGENVPEGHPWRTVNTRKGKVPTAPAYRPRERDRGIQPKRHASTMDVDWDEVERILGC